VVNDDTDLDVLAGEPSRARRRWPLGVLVVLLALALIGKWADGQQRHHEFTALLAKTADAQATAIDAQRKVLSTRVYTMPLLVSSSSATVRSGLAQLIDDAAAKGRTELQKSRNAIASLAVLPWHHAMRAARRADLAYVDQRIADLDEVAHGGDLKALNSTQAAAAAIVAAAALESAATSAAESARVAATLDADQ
jgi:hypothetical protein